jgi:hypothetical protein
MKVNGQLQAPAALAPNKELHVPIRYEAGWAHSRSVRYREVKPILPLSGMKLGFLGRSAHSLVAELSN